MMASWAKKKKKKKEKEKEKEKEKKKEKEHILERKWTLMDLQIVAKNRTREDQNGSTSTGVTQRRKRDCSWPK